MKTSPLPATLSALAAIALTAAATAMPAAEKPRPAKVTATAPGKPASGRDWSHVAAFNAQGNLVLGNPAARVKVVEYLSFTCPHCAAFSAESAAELKGQMIRSGSTSLEFRPTVRDTADLAATLLIRCQGAGGYADMAAAIFAAQPQWLPGAFYYLEHDAPRYAMRDGVDQIRLAAKGAGLIDLMLARGMAQARIDACLGDRAAIDQAVRAADAWRPVVDGTPTFVINGEKHTGADWATIGPILRAKGAR